LILGAGGESRTPDLRITNALLYQLSYTGTVLRPRIASSETGNAGKPTILAETGGTRHVWGLVSPNDASMPFHMICTPMHMRMNADSRITTASPVAPRVRCSRSAKAKQK
jgi:hypothetical protein